MTEINLKRWHEAMIKLDDAETDIMNCSWLSCKGCILRNEDGDCERTKIQHAISQAAKRIEHEIERAKLCPTCGRVMDGEN